MINAYRYNTTASGSIAWLFAVCSLLLLGGALYISHILFTCYEFAVFQHTMRKHIESQTDFSGIMEDPVIQKFLDENISSLRQLSNLHSRIKQGDLEGGRQHLYRIIPSHHTLRLDIEDALDTLSDKDEANNTVLIAFKKHLKQRHQQGIDYDALRTGVGLLFGLTTLGASSDSAVDIKHIKETAVLPFFESALLEGLPVISTLDESITKTQLYNLLKNASPNTNLSKLIAKFKEIKNRSDMLRTQNQKLAPRLISLGRTVEIIENKENNALITIQKTLLYFTLESRRPKIPKWIQNSYKRIRCHARKFGENLPPFE